jgi:fructose-1,6-bisphosphatase/inositol monophosphatase family enzyme
MLDETYWAVRGGGSFKNGERLAASRVSTIEECCFSPCGLHVAAARPHMTAMVELMQRSWSVRSFGGALDACLVAAGQVDFWFEPKVEPWDLAPLKLIVEEAGASFFALDGSRAIDRGSAVACVGGLEAEVRRTLGVPL